MHKHAISPSDHHRIVHHGGSTLNGLIRLARATTYAHAEQKEEQYAINIASHIVCDSLG